MTIAQMQEEIRRFKKENDFLILAHCYQSQDILEVADFVGDSYSLSEQATTVKNKNILMCGVKFMAETVKILSPDKRVFISSTQALCPMAEQMDKEMLLALKEDYPEHKVVAYINTTADLKTVCDVCVTSSSAIKIVKNVDSDKILFIPDANLGAFVKEQVKDKEIRVVNGGCPTHIRIRKRDVDKMKSLYPNAKILVHPECLPEVVELADYVGSTTGIMNYAKNSNDEEFIIGTENSIVEHLQFDCSDKMFYPLSKDCVCHNMQLTTLADVLNAVKMKTQNEILLDDETIKLAKKPLDEMMRLGK